jgi:hypothetical protein
VKCYACGKTWHMSWDCPEKKKDWKVEKLTFPKHRRGMWRKKQQKKGDPS